MKKIRLQRIETAFYVPDFDEDFYKKHGITTIEQAKEIDLTSLRDGSASMDEIASDEWPEVTYTAEIVEVSDDPTNAS